MNWGDIFEYKEGVLLRKVRVANCSNVGEVAGRIDAFGYVVVKFKQKAYRGHRIVWEMFNGEIPKGMQIDHINQNRSDNRIENLRIVTNQQNSKNRSMSSRNKSGVNGVGWCKREGKWIVQSRKMNKTVFIGYFNDFNDAVKARQEYDGINGFTDLHGSINKGYENTRG